jgi:hypothetical protein
LSLDFVCGMWEVCEGWLHTNLPSFFNVRYQPFEGSNYSIGVVFVTVINTPSESRFSNDNV